MCLESVDVRSGDVNGVRANRSPLSEESGCITLTAAPTGEPLADRPYRQAAIAAGGSAGGAGWVDDADALLRPGESRAVDVADPASRELTGIVVSLAPDRRDQRTGGIGGSSS
jgi:hypothetical protein